jgi:hypothetical protein
LPARAESLAVTERYRSGMVRLRQQGQREAKRIWNGVNPDDLDATFPLGQLELTVSTLQREAARLSSAYLSTFIASELGEPERPPALSVWDKAFGGGDLREGLRSAVIKTKAAIGEGEDPRRATKAGRKVLVSDVGLFIDTAARESLRQGMEMDPRIEGWQRSITGTCGACSGDVAVEVSTQLPSIPLNIHPSCRCVTVPVLVGLPNAFPLLSGIEAFDRKNPAEQDEMLGPEVAEKVRQGEVMLADLVEVDGGFITQKPVTALEGKAAMKREYVRDREGRFAETADSGDDKPKIPQWKRDRRYNGWVRSLSPEEQEVLARQFYEKLWKELRAYFGAFGELPPNMVFTDNIPEQFQGLVFQDEKGMRQVQLRPSQVLELALRGGGQQRATALVVHEWRHIFQNASLFYIGREQPHDQQPIEQDAHNFASRVLNLIYKNRSRKRKRKPLIRPVPYNPENISENIGKDPTMIPYPQR